MTPKETRTLETIRRLVKILRRGDTISRRVDAEIAEVLLPGRVMDCGKIYVGRNGFFRPVAGYTKDAISRAGAMKRLAKVARAMTWPPITVVRFKSRGGLDVHLSKPMSVRLARVDR